MGYAVADLAEALRYKPGGRGFDYRWCHWNLRRYGRGVRGVYGVLVGKPEGNRPLRRPRRRWVDNIMMDLQEVGCGYVDWIGLAQNRDRWRTLVSAVMNLRVPWNAGNFLTSCKPVSFSRRTLHHGVGKYGRGIDSSSNRNEYGEYFLGSKGSRCVRLTILPPSCADCLEIWEPQTPRTFRTCPGL